MSRGIFSALTRLLKKLPVILLKNSGVSVRRNCLQERAEKKIEEGILKAFETGEADVEAELVARDGRKKPHYFTGRRIEYEGRSCLIGMGIDVSKRKQAEEELKASLQEKNTLLQELYHRTKNNMQVISALLELQAASSNNEDVERIIRESQFRMQTMALAHEKLYKSKELSRIDMEPYLIDLTRFLMTIYDISPEKVGVRFKVDNIKLLIDLAIPCGLIINELLSNSFKYAFPGDREGRIYIEMHREEKTIQLSVSDNGTGLPHGFDITKSETLGIQLVYQIVEHQLHGSVSAKSNGGLRWHIRFREDLYSERV
ncbi:MAG: PAS domain S-box protein [Chitinivibrionales bacterium]|nr:PAS domain S-box protein [Chitinivibrionales bacterium]